MDAMYPIWLRLAGSRVLLVGGGNLARQKLRGLAPTGARVRLVAPALAPDLAEGFPLERLDLHVRTFREDDLHGVALAFGATDDPAVNRHVVEAARRLGVPANAVDDPPFCDFYTPAVLRRNGLELAVSTSGGFPGLTRAVREVLEAWLPADHDDAMADLFALRRALLRSPLDAEARGAVLRDLARRIATDYLQPAAPPDASAAGPASLASSHPSQEHP